MSNEIHADLIEEVVIDGEMPAKPVVTDEATDMSDDSTDAGEDTSSEEETPAE